MITQNTVFVTYMCGFCCFVFGHKINTHTHTHTHIPKQLPLWSGASRRSPLIAWRSRVQGVFIKLSRCPQENSNLPQEHTPIPWTPPVYGLGILSWLWTLGWLWTYVPGFCCFFLKVAIRREVLKKKHSQRWYQKIFESQILVTFPGTGIRVTDIFADLIFCLDQLVGSVNIPEYTSPINEKWLVRCSGT